MKPLKEHIKNIDKHVFIFYDENDIESGRREIYLIETVIKIVYEMLKFEEDNILLNIEKDLKKKKDKK